MKVLLIGEYYSTNLGDPLLCRTVRNVIEEAYPQAQVIPFDLSGMISYEEQFKPVTFSWRQRMYFRLTNRLPGLCQYSTLIRSFQHSEARCMRVCCMLDELLEQNSFDLVVFAGGSIFMDYFAVAINRIVKRFDGSRTGIMFHACGMSSLSKDSVVLLQKAFCSKNVRWISLRDSYDRFRNIFHTRAEVKETYDTALLCSQYFLPAGEKVAEYGIGVLDSLEYYESQKNLIKSFIQEGKSFRLFTNGACADYSAALRICRELGLEEWYLEERPIRPQELVTAVTRFNKIISFRMHSQITAASFGVPSVGFCWDDKIRQFYTKLGYRDNYILPENEVSAEELVKKLVIDSVALKMKAYSQGCESKEMLLDGMAYALGS